MLRTNAALLHRGIECLSVGSDPQKTQFRQETYRDVPVLKPGKRTLMMRVVLPHGRQNHVDIHQTTRQISRSDQEWRRRLVWIPAAAGTAALRCSNLVIRSLFWWEEQIHEKGIR